jgi:hypothetical protein
MTKTLVHFRGVCTSLVLAAAFFITAYAHAEVIDSAPKYTTGEGEVSHWQVANITPDGYVNPDKDGTNQYTKYSNRMLTNAGWVAARAGIRSAWTTDGSGWITYPEASQSDSKIANGFYAFKYDLWAAQSGVTDIKIDFTYSADDYLAAVLMVGPGGVVNNVWSQDYRGDQSKQWDDPHSVTLEGISVVANGDYEFIFVVHNTREGSPNILDNPMGLNLDFTITSNISFTDTPPSTAPEPATMLMFGLGIAGVAAARRIRRK